MIKFKDNCFVLFVIYKNYLKNNFAFYCDFAIIIMVGGYIYGKKEEEKN